jgi:hypothetical protein
MRVMKRDRLDITIDVLRDVAAAKRGPFDMGAWIGMQEPESPCSTACCAFGYAALDSRLQAQGLSLGYNNDGNAGAIQSIADFNAMMLAADPDKDVPSVYPMFGGLSGFHAAQKFYGITGHAAEYLFEPGTYRKAPSDIEPEDVIERIERVIQLEGQAPDDDDDA